MSTSNLTPNQQAASLLFNQLEQENPDWKAFRKTLLSNPEVVVHARYNDGSNLLFVACCKNAPLSVVQLMIRQHPGSVTAKNHNGDTPLTGACSAHGSLKVIQYLVQQHPNSLKEKNIKSCDLPLHCACAYNQTLEVIQWLALQYPDAVKAKDKHGWLPLHLACARKPLLEVIQWLVQQQPHLINEREQSGYTPLDLARQPSAGYSTNPKVVQWLEEFSAGQSSPRKLPPAILSNLSPGHDKKTPNLPSPSPITTVVDQKHVKPPAAGPKSPRKLPPARSPGIGETKPKGPALPPTTAAAAAANDEAITIDRRSVLAVLVGKNEMAAVSPSYIEAIRTEEVIGTGFFGTVYKGTDVALNRSFAIKAIDTYILWDGHSVVAQKSKESFLTEMKAFSLYRHPNIETLYGYTVSDHVRPCCYLVCELAEKGSLENFWKNGLGSERLSLFRRRIQIALDVMTAIQFLHIGNDQVSSCFRCNIKSSNIVLKRDFTAQLIDCGLEKFGAIDKDSQSKKTTGYLSSECRSGSEPIERSCDILSFGVVLAELLTGEPQNHKDEHGTSIKFGKLYVKDAKDAARDIRKDIDPALGYDTLALPKYVQDFADLAICCRQPKSKDRPAGEAVIAKLWAIWSQCCNGISVEGSVPGILDNGSKDTCKICRTFPPVSPQSLCPVCKSAEDRRALLSFRGESRRHLMASKAKLESSSLSFLSYLDVRLNNPVPRLFVIVPMCIKTGMTDPKVWLRSSQRTRYCLFFVCIHSMIAIAPPVPIIVTKCWLEKLAPVLAMSLYLLQLGLEPEGCVELGFGEVEVTLKLNSTKIEKLLEAVSEILAETSSSDLLARLRGSKELEVEDIGLLNGDAYELIVEAAGEESGWRDCMEPVRKDGSPQTFWVSKEMANDTSNGYEMVQV